VSDYAAVQESRGVALLVKSRQIPNPDDNVFGIKPYDDYDGMAVWLT
jgi:hypothetical protein